MQQTIDRVVLDTNVALDWLLFADPAAARLAADITAQRVQWIYCAAMHREWADVVARPLSDRWERPRRQALAHGIERHARRVEGACTPAHSTLTCSDRDDQMFVDLALAHRARWLVTRDRALLKLAAGALRLGLSIVRPVDWPALG